VDTIAIIGAHNIADKSDACVERITVAATYQHRLYNQDTTDYDIALLKLSSDTVHPAIPISSSKDILAGGADVMVAGWGTLESGGKSPDKLVKAFVETMTNRKCNTMYDDGEITDRMLCAASDGKDACQGDSGGPLFTVRAANGKTSMVQVGVVSRGKGCAEKGNPGVYSRISALEAFIKSVLSEETDSEIVLQLVYIAGGDDEGSDDAGSGDDDTINYDDYYSNDDDNYLDNSEDYSNYSYGSSDFMYDDSSNSFDFSDDISSEDYPSLFYDFELDRNGPSPRPSLGT
jgi:trypsin